MWFLYILLAIFFIFLSQLSGLPQAMFYHLHWAVALPMAFMGFLVLIPGFIKEVVMFIIWPVVRPFVQLLIEAVGFVNAENDATPSYSIDAPPTIVQTTVGSVLPLTVRLITPRIEPPLAFPNHRRKAPLSLPTLRRKNSGFVTGVRGRRK